MHLQSHFDTYFKKDTHRTVLYFLVYDQELEKQKDLKNVMCIRGNLASTCQLYIFNSIVYLSLMLIYNIHTIINIKHIEIYQPILYRITRDYRWQISKHYTYIYTYIYNR